LSADSDVRVDRLRVAALAETAAVEMASVHAATLWQGSIRARAVADVEKRDEAFAVMCDTLRREWREAQLPTEALMRRCGNQYFEPSVEPSVPAKSLQVAGMLVALRRHVGATKRMHAARLQRDTLIEKLGLLAQQLGQEVSTWTVGIAGVQLRGSESVFFKRDAALLSSRVSEAQALAAMLNKGTVELAEALARWRGTMRAPAPLLVGNDDYVMRMRREADLPPDVKALCAKIAAADALPSNRAAPNGAKEVGAKGDGGRRGDARLAAAWRLIEREEEVRKRHALHEQQIRTHATTLGDGGGDGDVCDENDCLLRWEPLSSAQLTQLRTASRLPMQALKDECYVFLPVEDMDSVH